MFDFLDDKEEYEYMDIKLYTGESIYIDSNIFMSDESLFFFDSLTKKNKIIMPSTQYRELYKLKESDDEEKAYKARKAFKIIEKLLDKDIITIKENGSNNTNYADPVFIKLITENAKEKIKVVFVTDDIDLRIKLKSELKKYKLEDNVIRIFTSKDILKKKGEKTKYTSTLKKTGKVAGIIVAGLVAVKLGL